MQNTEQEISDLILKHSRDINMLLDEKRPAVSSALENLAKVLESGEISASAKLLFFESKMLKNFLATIDNPSDNVRENSLKFISSLNSILTDPSISSKLSQETKDILLIKISARVSETPFKESSEELRLKINRLLLELLPNFKESFHKHFTEITQTCSALLKDKFPENKRQTCELLIRLSLEFPEMTGLSCRRLLGPLLSNCSHAHSKVRKISVGSIGRLLILPKASENFPEVFEAIRVVASDKNPEIREEYFWALGLCLEHFGLSDLKQSETSIIAELLSALADESERIRKLAKDALQDFSARRKILFEKFGA